MVIFRRKSQSGQTNKGKTKTIDTITSAQVSNSNLSDYRLYCLASYIIRSKVMLKDEVVGTMVKNTASRR